MFLYLYFKLRVMVHSIGFKPFVEVFLLTQLYTISQFKNKAFVPLDPNIKI